MVQYVVKQLCVGYINPFATVLMSYVRLIMRKLVAVCPYDEYTWQRHESHSSNAVAHRVAEISLLLGTWHAIGYLWGAAPNVMEIPPGS